MLGVLAVQPETWMHCAKLLKDRHAATLQQINQVSRQS